MCFFHLNKPLIYFHQSFGRHSRIYFLSINRLIPLYFLTCIFSSFDNILMSFFHEFEHFRELLLIFYQYFKSSHWNLKIFERIWPFCIWTFVEVDSHQIRNYLWFSSAHQVETNINWRWKFTVWRSYHINVTQEIFELIKLQT